MFDLSVNLNAALEILISKSSEMSWLKYFPYLYLMSIFILISIFMPVKNVLEALEKPRQQGNEQQVEIDISLVETR